MAARGKGEEAACLGDLLGISLPVGNQVFFGVGDGFNELGFGLCADQFDILLKP